MSVEAISWALNHAPVDNPTAKFVLVALANHARPDGSAAFPSVATICRYTCLSERAVRSHLDRLESAGVITRCDPGIVAAYISRSDRRPVGWDLCISLRRNEVQEAHPDTLRGAARSERGAPDADGVHVVHERGAPDAPEPYMNRTSEPSKEIMSNVVDDISEATRLCHLLADLMVENGCKRPTVSAGWIRDMDRLMRLDGRSADQVEAAIRWSQAHDFWAANIHSPGKLRMKYDVLRMQATREMQRAQPRGFSGIRQFLQDEGGI